jgi:fermentation-respiration switch protein FrsA (DUF1100 family)
MQQTVRFTSNGDTLVGDLSSPGDLAPGERRPGVVVTGSWTTVRQQMPGLYARRLAERGFVALAFDFRGYGESEGAPRDCESPARKAEDIAAAAAWLGGHDRIKPGGVHSLAVCASSGYAARAVADGAPLRSLALVAPWVHDARLVEGIYGGAEGVAARLAKAAGARARFEANGEVEYVPAVSTSDENAAMFGAFDYYLDASRGAIPEWSNRFAVMAWNEWLRYDAIAIAPAVPVPVFVVHGEGAAIPEGAKRFFAGLRVPKGWAAIDGNQFDFYDRESNVGLSIEHAIAHFERNGA